MATPAFARRPVQSPRSREINSVARELATGRLTTREALKGLKNRGKNGYQMAGEVCLLKATTTPVGSNQWFDLSKKYLQKASSSLPTEHYSATTLAVAKSLVRIGQLPLIHSIVTGRALADQDRMQKQTQAAYTNTVQVGMWLSHLMEQPESGVGTKQREMDRAAAADVCNELGVLALAHRFAVKERIPDKWIVASALLSNTTDTDPGGIARRGKWDISIWACQRPETARIQAATERIRLHAAPATAQYEDAATHAIHLIEPGRDLDVYGIPERFIGSQILHDCWAEMADPLHARQSRQALEQQTNLLLDILAV